MTFEEFFKKKKIDLAQLAKAEPVLFAEFESHYAQMGEKSFDHTKKYWFNNLRRLYHTADEPKVEKVHIENQIAEQTITESITEKVETPPAPKVGFTPRFKAGATKPAEQTKPEIPTEETPTAVVGVVTNNSTPEFKGEDTPKPAVGFKPRFKAGVTKPAEEIPNPVAIVGVPTNNSTPEVIREDTPKPAVGFKPRFKAGVTKPAEETKSEVPAEETPTAVVDVITNDSTPEAPKPAVGFKPRFKAGVTKPAEETKPEIPVEETPTAVVGVITNNSTPEDIQEAQKPTVGFKPRFKAGITKPKQEE